MWRTLFFAETHGLVRVIPYQDVPTDDNPLADPPGSLLDGVACLSGRCCLRPDPRP